MVRRGMETNKRMTSIEMQDDIESTVGVYK